MLEVVDRLLPATNVSTLLEIQRQGVCGAGLQLRARGRFQPFLRFNNPNIKTKYDGRTPLQFQPFLRFNGSCVRFLWVFKFFYGFL